MPEIKHHAAIVLYENGDCLVAVRGADEESEAAGPVKTTFEAIGEEIKKLTAKQEDLQKAADAKPKPAPKAAPAAPAKTSVKAQNADKGKTKKEEKKPAPSIAALSLF